MTVEITVTKGYECPVLKTGVFVEGHYQIPKDEKSKEPAIFLFADCRKTRAKQVESVEQPPGCERLPSECGCYNIYPRIITDPYRHAR